MHLPLWGKKWGNRWFSRSDVKFSINKSFIGKHSKHRKKSSSAQKDCIAEKPIGEITAKRLFAYLSHC